jgi:hypothetical protein
MLYDVQTMTQQLEAMQPGAGGSYRAWLAGTRAALEAGMANFIERDFDGLGDLLDLRRLLPLLGRVDPLELLGQHHARWAQAPLPLPYLPLRRGGALATACAAGAAAGGRRGCRRQAQPPLHPPHPLAPHPLPRRPLPAQAVRALLRRAAGGALLLPGPVRGPVALPGAGGLQPAGRHGAHGRCGQKVEGKF